MSFFAMCTRTELVPPLQSHYTEKISALWQGCLVTGLQRTSDNEGLQALCQCTQIQAVKICSLNLR